MYVYFGYAVMVSCLCFGYHGLMASVNIVDTSIARGFVNARNKARKSQEDVAKYMSDMGFGWHASTVSKIERGERRLTAGEGVVLARYLSTTVEKMSGMKSAPEMKVREIDDLAASVIDLLGNLASYERECAVALADLRKEVASFTEDDDALKRFNSQFYGKEVVGRYPSTGLLKVMGYFLDEMQVEDTYQQLLKKALQDYGIQLYIAFSRNGDSLIAYASDEARQQIYKRQAEWCDPSEDVIVE